MNDETPDVIDHSALRELLSDELRSKVDTGEYIITGPGSNDKPVVVDADTGRWVKGSGRSLNAPDSAYVGQVTAYKRSKAYNEALEMLVPAWAGQDEAPDAIISFQELIQAAKEAIIGEPEYREIVCVHCEEKSRVFVGRKRDNKVLMFMIERLAGAANKTSTVNIHSEELIRMLSEERVLHEGEFVALSTEERANRIRAVQDA